MIKKPLFLLLLTGLVFLTNSVTSNAQVTEVSGIIKDAESNETIPFVNVILTVGLKGTTTDFDGYFYLKSNRRYDTLSLIVSAVGYKSLKLPLNKYESNQFDIILEPTNYRLEEITIKGKRSKIKDTAAITLYRNVVKNKSDNRESGYDYYYYENYQKLQFDLFNISEEMRDKKWVKPFEFAFENTDTTADGREFLPALLKETVSDVYFRKSPSSKSEILKAEKFSGIENNSISKFIDFQFDDIDVYDNVIFMANKSFIGPFANAALMSYKYFLVDSAYKDSKWCYKLEFTGRNDQSLTFIGYAWIHDTTFAIQNVRLKVLDDINVNFVSDFGMEQTFSLMPDGSWFKTYETMYSTMNITKNEDKTGLRITKRISKEDVTLNEPFDESVFKGDALKIEEGARERDEDYWLDTRHTELNRQESNIYGIVDSIQKTKAYKKYKYIGYLGLTAHLKAGPVEFGPFYKFASWNDVEGFRLRIGGRTNKEFSKKWYVEGYGAYGFKSKEVKYSGLIRTNLKRSNDKWHQLGGGYRFDYTRLGNRHQVLTHDNIATSILNKGGISKLMDLRNLHVYYEKEWLAGFSNLFQFNNKRFFEVPGVFEFETLLENGEVAALESFKTSEVRFQTRWGHKEVFYENNQFIRSPILANPLPVLIFDYTAGIKGLFGGDYTYHKLEFSLRHRWPNPLGYTRYNLFAGKIFGDVPYPLMRVHVGNETFVNNLLAYGLMNEFEYVSDEYAALWIDHHFDGLIMNKIPLIRKLKLRSILTAKALIGRVKESNKDLILFPDDLDSPSDGYIELGFGIENILKMLRVDFMWRVTQRKKEEIQHWGIKVYISPKF